MFSGAQFGFKSLRSSALQILDVMEILTELTDQGCSFDCIYYDLIYGFRKDIKNCELKRFKVYIWHRLEISEAYK